MKKSSKRIIITSIVLLVFVATASLTFGKYVYNSAWNYYLSSKGFYFESDLLNINTKKNSILKWDGSDVYFDIRNSQNEKLISEYDISYKVTCEVMGDESNYIDCNLNGEDSSTFSGSLASVSKCINDVDETDVTSYIKSECELNGYIWNEEISSKNNYFNLELIDATKSIDEVSIRITAESLAPYHQTLIGIFNLNRVDSVDLEIVTDYQNYSEYDELSITNTTTSDKCVLIDFDSKNYSIDLDIDSVLEYNADTNNNINQIKVKVPKENSIIYKFYKINSEKVYSINDFTVEEKEC